MATIDGGDLAELEAYVGGMLKSLQPAQRRKLLRKVATTMRRENQARIKAQKNPDGSKYAPRKAQPKPVMGNFVAKFLYPAGGSGEPRVVFMKSWRKEGPLITGHDEKAGDIRSFEWAKIIKWLDVSPEEQNKGGGKIRNRTTIRQRAMFRKLSRSGSLSAQTSDYEAWIGFGGAIAQVAQVHQFGLKDRPARHAREIRYARRELLGMTAQDRENLLDAVIAHMTDGI